MSVLVPETLAIGGLVIVGAQPVAAAVTLVMDKCGKMRAARDARLAQWRAPEPPGAVAVAAPGSPPRPGRSETAAARAETVRAAIEAAPPGWTWAQIGAASGMSGNQAKGVWQRARARTAAANGSVQ